MLTQQVMQAKMACDQFFLRTGGSLLDKEVLDDPEDESVVEPVEGMNQITA